MTTEEDLDWLRGYRMRASGQPRPKHLHDSDVVAIEGWEDLDALLKLIEQALASSKSPAG